jgi:hypothetical protein
MTQLHVIEPVTAIAVVTIAGVATGLHYHVLIAGLAGAITTLAYQEPGSLLIRCSKLISSTLMAGYTAPAVAAYLQQKLGLEIHDVFPAFLIGAFAQWIILYAITWLRGKSNV